MVQEHYDQGVYAPGPYVEAKISKKLLQIGSNYFDTVCICAQG